MYKSFSLENIIFSMLELQKQEPTPKNNLPRTRVSFSWCLSTSGHASQIIQTEIIKENDLCETNIFRISIMTSPTRLIVPPKL